MKVKLSEFMKAVQTLPPPETVNHRAVLAFANGIHYRGWHWRDDPPDFLELIHNGETWEVADSTTVQLMP